MAGVVPKHGVLSYPAWCLEVYELNGPIVGKTQLQGRGVEGTGSGMHYHTREPDIGSTAW